MTTAEMVTLGISSALGAMWVARRMGQVSRAEARRLVEAGATLIDVRTPEEFTQKHLPNAKNVPLRELTRDVSVVGPLSQSVVLYCATGTRSALAASVLRRAGFTQVANLGAMGRW